jgi:DNA-binding response OmpR family regulator
MAEILLVDDDEILIDLLRFRLEDAGHYASVAADGEAALSRLRKVKPALMILDSMMPVMAGIEVLTAMRADPSTRSIPVIMLTARKSEADVVSALRAGADDYLTKPFMPQELLARVEVLLSKAERDRSVSRAH